MTNNNNPFVVRFSIGDTYRLKASAPSNGLLVGDMKVIAELKPRDQWGNRILLVDISLDDSNPPDMAGRIILGARCFVEEGVAEVMSSYGSRMVASELATVQGVYPHFAKAYATDRAVSMKVA